MTDQEWYRRRALVLNRSGRALTKDEHDRLTEGLGRALTDDPVMLRKGRDIVGQANETAKSRARLKRGAA